MAAPPDPEQPQQLLSATYNSSTNASFTHHVTLPSPIPNSTASKTAYLSTLRKSVATIQEAINTDLTKRMEEDKARDAASTKTAGVDEAKEEENYGEEVVDED